jgi:hypothetical protein
LYGAFGVKRISLWASDFFGAQSPSVASRWHDCGERVEVEIDDGLKGLGGDTIAQAVGQRVMPGSGPSVRRPTVTDLGKRLLDLAAGAISRLSFGVAEGVLAGGLATLWHALFSVT